jgi:hypothetical protein
MDSTATILNMKPTVLAAADGWWLAVAGPEAPVRMGVLEPSEAEARLRFEDAKQRLVDALERKPVGPEA